ncbi:hypothetical protein AAMO2058_000386700 [Amorphochlora amoebiformis]|mmetsp:Transcript_8596/g.13489  ORF Transcript_8596/g.13489 Transcript_8596/m.13489 type:complete len:251 (-) Transcript_8596:54-806(-)
MRPFHLFHVIFSLTLASRSSINRGLSPCHKVTQSIARGGLWEAQPFWSRRKRSVSSVLKAFALPSIRDPTAEKDRELDKKRETEFRINKGRLITWIRLEIPNMFKQRLNLEPLRDDLKIQVSLVRYNVNFTLEGKHSYRLWTDIIRVVSALIFEEANISYASIYRDIDPLSPTVRVRWTIRGRPWLSCESGFPVQLDFLSVYELDEMGLVQELVLTDIAPKWKNPSVADDIPDLVVPTAGAGPRVDDIRK